MLQSDSRFSDAQSFHADAVDAENGRPRSLIATQQHATRPIRPLDPGGDQIRLSLS
jgi:hypothetical protein